MFAAIGIIGLLTAAGVCAEIVDLLHTDWSVPSFADVKRAPAPGATRYGRLIRERERQVRA